MPLPGNGYKKAVVPWHGPFSPARCCRRNTARCTRGGEFGAGEVKEGVSQGGLRMEPRQRICSAARNQLCRVVFSLVNWGRRMLKGLYGTASRRTEGLVWQLQVAAEHIIWDQKPEAMPQALLLIC